MLSDCLWGYKVLIVVFMDFWEVNTPPWLPLDCQWDVTELEVGKRCILPADFIWLNLSCQLLRILQPGTCFPYLFLVFVLCLWKTALLMCNLHTVKFSSFMYTIWWSPSIYNCWINFSITCFASTIHLCIKSLPAIVQNSGLALYVFVFVCFFDYNQLLPANLRLLFQTDQQLLAQLLPSCLLSPCNPPSTAYSFDNLAFPLKSDLDPIFFLYRQVVSL